jgi:hypothetical protein
VEEGDRQTGHAGFQGGQREDPDRPLVELAEVATQLDKLWWEPPPEAQSNSARLGHPNPADLSEVSPRTLPS